MSRVLVDILVDYLLACGCVDSRKGPEPRAAARIGVGPGPARQGLDPDPGSPGGPWGGGDRTHCGDRGALTPLVRVHPQTIPP